MSKVAYVAYVLISFHASHAAWCNPCASNLGASLESRIYRFNPNLRSEDPFEILGVKRDDTVETIQSAYREAARRYHPDTGEEMDDFAIKKVNAAYTRIRIELSKASSPTSGETWFDMFNENGTSFVARNPFMDGSVVVRKATYKTFGISGTFFLDWNKASEPATPDYSRILERLHSYLQDHSLSPKASELLDGNLAQFAALSQAGTNYAFESTVQTISEKIKNGLGSDADFLEAAKAFVEVFYGPYLESTSSRSCYSVQHTQKLLAENKLLPILVKNPVLPDFPSQLNGANDPRVFYLKVVDQLLFLASSGELDEKIDEILDMAAKTHVEKFGGTPIHFIGFTLAFYNVQLSGPKLSHFSSEEQTVIQGVVNSLKRRLVPELALRQSGTETMSSGKDLQMTGDFLARAVSYFRILALWVHKIPIDPIVHNDIVPIARRNAVSIPRRELFDLFKNVPPLETYIRSELGDRYDCELDEFALHKPCGEYGVHSRASWVFTWHGSESK